jgi:hypothetical protein
MPAEDVLLSAIFSQVQTAPPPMPTNPEVSRIIRDWDEGRQDALPVSNLIQLALDMPSYRDDVVDYMKNDMPQHPNRYGRQDTYEIIKRGLISSNEMVNAGLMTVSAVNWVKGHPTDSDDDHQSQFANVTNPDSPLKNTDVYFFGIPGSGKSTVLACLLALENNPVGNIQLQLKEGCTGFLARLLALENNPVGNIQLQLKEGCTGFVYGQDLRNYIREGIFPRATQTNVAGKGKFIQLMQVVLHETRNGVFAKDKDVKLSIIEMPGERTKEFAGVVASVGRPNMALLGDGAQNLLANDNDKIVFFVIDPNDEVNISINVSVNGQNLSVSMKQGEVLKTIVAFMRSEKDFCRHLKKVYVLVTKTDSLEDLSLLDPDSKHSEMVGLARKVVARSGYNSFWTELCTLVYENKNINKGLNPREPIVMPFSPGRVMPGHTLSFEPSSPSMMQFVSNLIL